MGRRMIDYSGKTCGCWEVIERDWNPASKSHETFWKAKCLNCGNKASVRKGALDKNPRYCNNCKGLSTRSWKIGDKFGKLVIIDKGQIKGNHSYVKVQCDCGSEPFEVRLEHLKGQCHSRTISCGCASESSGEMKIYQILEKLNINFQKQYRIKNEHNEVMIFDFVIFDKNNNILKCIEYNGEQHYKPVELFGGEEAFKKQKIRDNRKTEYCQTHGIILQWIPYFDFDLINSEYLKLEEFLVAE